MPKNIGDRDAGGIPRLAAKDRAEICDGPRSNRWCRTDHPGIGAAPMSAALLSRSSYRERASLGSRLSALALALGVAALVILLLIQLGILPPPLSKNGQRLLTFNVPPPMRAEAARTHAEKPKQADGGSAAPRVAPPSPPAPAPRTPTPLPQLIQLNDADFAASDIGKMAAQPSDNAAGAGGGKGNGSVYGPGEGPGGAQLYRADWYRRPSHAELATYLPKDGPSTGYGLIACKTIPDYHVDNCRVLSETPGSGYGTAIRRAAWQFLVLPPRLGDKPMLGVWVRIEIDITPAGADLR